MGKMWLKLYWNITLFYLLCYKRSLSLIVHLMDDQGVGKEALSSHTGGSVDQYNVSGR